MNNPKEIVTALLTSYGYNREADYMLQLCEEIKKRIEGCYVTQTDDGDNIFGFLICLYGDYGTSPRSGWINNPQVEEDLISGIDSMINDCTLIN